MKALSLYSGIGGLDLAAHLHGIETVAFCEMEPFCRRVLAHYWPDVPIYERDEDVTADRLRRDGIDPAGIDLVIGGPPCQPSSAAGKRLGTADSRWRWPDAIRIVRDVEPRWVCFENPRGIRTVNAGLAFGTILRELAALGYRVGYDEWAAADVGAPHRRERVFIIGRRLAEAPRTERQCRGASSRIAASGEVQHVRPTDSGAPGLADPDSAKRWSLPQGRHDAYRHDARRPEAPSGLAACGADVHEWAMAHTEQQQSRERCDVAMQRGWTRPTQQVGLGGGSGSGSVADANSPRPLQPQGAISHIGRRSSHGGQADSRAFGVGLADAETAGLPFGGFSVRGEPGQPRPQHGSARNGPDAGATLIPLGVDASGIAAGLLDHPWPARPGEEQHPDEPPRLAKGEAERVAKLKALGNAVVPQQAAPIFAAIVAVEREGGAS